MRVEQGAAEEADPGGTPAGLPRELLDVAFRFLISPWAAMLTEKKAEGRRWSASRFSLTKSST